MSGCGGGGCWTGTETQLGRELVWFTLYVFMFDLFGSHVSYYTEGGLPIEKLPLPLQS